MGKRHGGIRFGEMERDSLLFTHINIYFIIYIYMSDDNSDTENDSVTSITKEFKELVVTWVDIDDSIRETNAKLKEFKEEKKQFEQAILDYLEKIGENVIEISDGKLRRNVSKTKGALKHDIIQNALTECVNDSEKAFQ